jgi:hypothetical protein
MKHVLTTKQGSKMTPNAQFCPVFCETGVELVTG